MLLKQDLAAIRDRSRRDPVWFVRNVLGSDPTDYQELILWALANHRMVTVRSCHGIGKSNLAGGQAAPWFLTSHYQSEVITTAPSLRQVQGIVWKEINRAHASAKLPLGGKCLRTRWDLAPGWFAQGFTTSANAPDKFQGWHPASGYGLVIVDEAAGIDERIYDEGISSIVSSSDSKILLIGNPTNPVGEFRNSHKPRSGYFRIKVDAFQTPNFVQFGITQEDIESGAWEEKLGDNPYPRPYLIVPEWVATRYKKWGRDSALYRARVLAEFPLEGADNLFPIYLLEQAQERYLPAEGVPRWGYDVAFEGDDFSKIGCKWPSGRYRLLYTWKKLQTEEQANLLEHKVREADELAPYEISVDSIGEGKGVYDLLSNRNIWNPTTKEMVTVGEFKGSHAARDKETFLNARAWGYFKLKEAFENGEVDIDPKDEDLFYQLSEIRFKPTAGGKVKIEDKKEFKARTGISPDDADAMMMAFAGFSRKKVFIR